MILVTGGMGFIGIHVARELAAHDDVVVGYNRTKRDPAEMERLIGAKVLTQHVDVASPYSLARAVATHHPTGIVHLAVPALGAMPPAEETLTNVTGLVNVLEAASVGGVERVSIASSLAVYAGLDTGPFREDRDLPVTSTSATSAMKKAEEILALHFADRTGLDLLLLRIGIVYGPLYQTLANPAGRLTYLAVKGELPRGAAASWSPAQLLGGLDLCYVEDCARAIATIHRARSTQHRIYNVGGGRTVAADELLNAVERAVPGAALPGELRHTGALERSDGHMDISRARDELGVEPRFGIEEAIAEYAAWLRDHDR
jgi:Nucleoside-diphosphate-sugar epimerases